MFNIRFVAVALVLALAACSGGGGGSSSSPSTGGGTTTAPGSASSTPQSVQLNVHIPGGTTTSATKRAPQFVAASTQGVLVVVYAHSDTSHSTPLGTSATNVAPGSSACGGATGARTCTISIPAPAGSDDFVFTTYDQPPSSSTSFPGTAHVLAGGSVLGQTITVATANVVNVTLGGAVATIYATPALYSQLAGVGAQTYTLEITALDAGGDVIIGPYDDANGNPNPVTVTVTETGGSGLTKIAVGSATPATTATVTQSSDVITVSYTGGGTAGYYATFNGIVASGPATATANYDPLFVSSTSPQFTFGATGTLNLTSGSQTAIVTLTEANATTAVDTSNCAGIATITPPSSSGTAQSFTITGSAAGGTCTININFAQANYTINVTAASNTSASVVVPGSLLLYTADGVNGVGIRNVTGDQLGSIPTSITADTVDLDDAGNVYILSWATTGEIAKYTPSATGYPPTYTASGATYTPTSPPIDNLYVSGAGEVVTLEENGAGTENIIDFWDPGHTGAPSRTITVPDPTGNLIYGAAIAHNGDFYYAQYVPCASNASLSCIEWTVVAPGSSTPVRTFNETHVADAAQSSVTYSYATVSANGTLYIDEWTYKPGDQNAGIYIYPPSGPETFAGAGATSPAGIGVDGTGNIYVANNNVTYDAQGNPSGDTAHTLNELSPDGQTILRSANVAVGPYPVTVAADGTTFVSTTLGDYVLLPANFTPTEIDTLTGNVALYDGTASTDGNLSHSRAPQSIGSGTAYGGNGGFHRFRRR